MADTICDRLGIAHPIVQGPMAWASDAGLAAAVSNAGGLGVLGIGTAPPEAARAEIRRTTALTDRPFGYNVYTFVPHVAEICDLLVEERVAVAEIGALPGTFDVLAGYVATLRAGGVAVIGKAASVDEAVAYEAAGVDFVSIKGADGGGHIFGFTGTFSLLPQVVDAVSIPVICGGGVADGRGLAAALVLGAAAVEVGSRFILAQECPVHQNYKDAVIRAQEGVTVVTGVVCGDAVRQLPNSLSDRLLKVERECTLEEAIRSIQQMATDSLRKAAVEGDMDDGCVTIGQNLGPLKKVQTAKEIVDEMMAESGVALRGAADLLGRMSQEPPS